MALAAFLLITTEDRDSEVRAAGYVYLVATRIGTLCLFAMFALALPRARDVGSRRTDRGAERAPEPPSSCSASSASVSRRASCRCTSGCPARTRTRRATSPRSCRACSSRSGSTGWSDSPRSPPHRRSGGVCVLLALGVASGVLGVAFAIGQHDLKRLLAYHSVENIGIICMGIGLALHRARPSDGRSWSVLGLAGALLHVWNHGLFKALLFLAAGSVLHATGTREIDQLGGLAKAMPRTGARVPDRRGGDLRPAAAQRLHQRAVHLPRPVSPDRRRCGRRFARRRASRRRRWR